MRSSRIALVVGLIGSITAALAYSFLQTDHPDAAITSVESTSESLDGTSTESAGTSAMRVSIDPETGGLVQSPATLSKVDDELQESLSRSTEGLVQVHHPDGSVSVNLQGRFQSASMARIDSSGKLHTTCVDNHGAANAFCDGKHDQNPVAEER